MSGAVGADTNRGRATLLASDLTSPWCVRGLLGGGEQLLEITISLPTTEVSARNLNLTADSLREGDSLRAVGEQCPDPPGSVERGATEARA